MIVSLRNHDMAPLQRDQLFQLRMTTEEKRMLQELADRAGVTPSDWVRLQVRQAFQPIVNEAMANRHTAEQYMAKSRKKK